jgi:flagellar biosynthesis protein FliP
MNSALLVPTMAPALISALGLAPSEPLDPTGITIDLPGSDKPGQSVVMLLTLSVLAVAPSLLLLTTAFTKIVVVLSLTRNALGLTSVPPNQVLAGLALFLSLFVMAPVISQINDTALQPYLEGLLSFGQAYDVGSRPLHQFMLDNTRKDELALMIGLSKEERPASAADVSMTTLIPAFVLSELRAAFIIGFVIFLPFLVIDMVISSFLMSIGTVMLPPVMISLPFKLLLFVMVDGWGLIVTALVGSYG